MNEKDLTATLQQLDQAIYNHEQWLKDVTRTVICRLPYDQRDVAKDAHHHCRFGQWYYGDRPQEIRDHAAFVAIETEHRRIHELGAKLLIASENDAPSATKDYDNFSSALEMLHLEISSLKHELEELLHNRDALTGADNRVSMLAKLRELHELVKRGIQTCTIVMFDLDHFKTVNDTYGHPAGDQVLVAWVSYIRKNLRTYDKVYRYGGEEFLLSFPNTTPQEAYDLVLRIQDGLRSVTIGTYKQKEIMVTASFGIAVLDSMISVEESISRSDTALYVAKEAGRNRACLWDSSMTAIQDERGGFDDLTSDAPVEVTST